MVTFLSYPSTEDVADQIRGEDAEDVFEFIEHLTRDARLGEKGGLRSLFENAEGYVVSNHEREHDIRAFAALLLTLLK